METVEINKVESLMGLVFHQEQDAKNGRCRSAFYYRGMPDASFNLTTSLQRNCGKDAEKLEPHLLENFRKYASIEDPSINESVWRAMIVGQHHGLPTRLLDWTHSPLVALHFANTVGNLEELDKNDCVVWRIDARELHKKLPEEYKQALKDKGTFMFDVPTLDKVAGTISKYDKDMGSKFLVMVEPPSIDQRIVNQYSFFTVTPLGIPDLRTYLEENTENTIKYVIDKSIRWDIRDMLDGLNMSERIIYPGIDGIAKWLARHYYVRNK